MRSVGYRGFIIGGVVVFMLVISCCWLLVLIIVIGGGSILLGLSDGLERFSGVFLFLGIGLFGFGVY